MTKAGVEDIRALVGQQGFVIQGPNAMSAYYVYIMSNESRTLYTGVTNHLARRVQEHKDAVNPGFTSRYQLDRLVYFETFSDIRDAIEAEKRIKGWRRSKKLDLIRQENPTWRDLSADWEQ